MTFNITVNGKPQTAPAFLYLEQLAERAGIEPRRARATFRRPDGRRGIVHPTSIERGGGVMVRDGVAFEVTRGN